METRTREKEKVKRRRGEEEKAGVWGTREKKIRKEAKIIIKKKTSTRKKIEIAEIEGRLY